MAINSKIEWTEHTANLWHGCTKVHAGCNNCYAETMTKRWGREIWGNDAPRLEIGSVWKDLAKMQREAQKADTMARVFIGSMMDIFEKPMPTIDSHGGMVVNVSDGSPTFTTENSRDKLFEEISDGIYPNLIFLFLTKRPSNIRKMVPGTWLVEPPANVMMGTSPCDQKTAETLVPQLVQNWTGKRFLSIEPLLGPVDLSKFFTIEHITLPVPWPNNAGIKTTSPFTWIITGGESGPKARPCHPDWIRSLRDQCATFGIPFFFKQWGEWIPYDQLFIEMMGDWDKRDKIGDVPIVRAGKKMAGNEIDYHTHLNFPWEAFSIPSTIKF